MSAAEAHAESFPEKVMVNATTLGRMQTFNSLVSGAVAGVLGITGLYGFLFYAATCYASTFLATLVAMPLGDVKAYFPMGNADLYRGGAGGVANFLTFVVAWMVLYNCIYVF
jgi:hypothetical protein